MNRTLKDIVYISGIGVHTNKYNEIRICPSELGNGILFRYIRDRGFSCFDDEDEIDSIHIVTNINNTSSNYGCSYATYKDADNDTYSNGYFSVSTIEHLFCSLYLLHIDDAIIEIDKIENRTVYEIPILDGSIYPIIFALSSIGIIEREIEEKKQEELDGSTDTRNRYIRIENLISVSSDNGYIEIVPCDKEENMCVDMTVEFMNGRKVNGDSIHKNVVHINDIIEMKELCRSRTFGFASDLEEMQKKGIARGSSLENSIGIDDNGNILNEYGLRNKNEFANHKIVDLLGDMYISGYRIVGNIRGYNTSHILNRSLIEKIIKEYVR